MATLILFALQFLSFVSDRLLAIDLAVFPGLGDKLQLSNLPSSHGLLS